MTKSQEGTIYNNCSHQYRLFFKMLATCGLVRFFLRKKAENNSCLKRKVGLLAKITLLPVDGSQTLPALKPDHQWISKWVQGSTTSTAKSALLIYAPLSFCILTTW